MKPRSNIVIAYTLAGLFALFNVGLPIVLFVCPMMSNGQVCDCNTTSTDQVSITYEHGNCCNHKVVAERNTIPFLSSSKYQSPGSGVIFVLSSGMAPCVQPAHELLIARVSNTGPPVPANPKYILSSALLI